MTNLRLQKSNWKLEEDKNWNHCLQFPGSFQNYLSGIYQLPNHDLMRLVAYDDWGSTLSLSLSTLILKIEGLILDLGGDWLDTSSFRNLTELEVAQEVREKISQKREIKASRSTLLFKP